LQPIINKDKMTGLTTTAYKTSIIFDFIFIVKKTKLQEDSLYFIVLIKIC